MNEAASDAFEWLLNIYFGMPIWAAPIFWVAAIVVVSSATSMVILIARAQFAIRRTERDPLRGTGEAIESEYLWVFMVPALNEEITIADSVGRLREVRVTHKQILVINDGSDDRTGALLAAMPQQGLTVLTRTMPEARQGKSEALNDAWRHLTEVMLTEGEYAHWDPRKVIVAIVDADGRLDPHAGRIAKHFGDERVGGVQSLVRIYNRKSVLTWAQNLEFAIFGYVYQMGRLGWGTANMGGNGQFNRLQALNDVAVAGSSGRLGPWREGRLTEDQDIGLRLIRAGWQGRQSTLVSIDQQGLNSLRALYRQRTRWAQGGWQMLDLVPTMAKNPNVGFVAKWDQFWYLMTPLLQAFMGATVLLSVLLFATGIVDVRWSIPIVVLIYVFSVAPAIAGAVFAQRSANPLRILLQLVFAYVYALYSLMIFPVVYRSLFRYLVGAGSWAKTRREAIAPPAGLPEMNEVSAR
ncbi:glycosyltransferase family 2 protein [Leucobacter sp. UT-8R-CII-1-4]|uniref:glycosyltransferase family 2 protein n=1 Tax=Leucobacter sp. UT-8R-CII-1-4 TaxID=3040075 RepID=UPI0024A8113A|nr:glycosyltransferase family 2 protein [Leucobacter sp. UT-8R-CII-1-4]MDI6023313.1 glycosyltransferase family 2 protein [Leucobacter sp. UT-8R-CII-1-4]